MPLPKNYARTIGVFYGSGSIEHQASCKTADQVTKELLSVGFNVVAVLLTKSGNWHLETMTLSGKNKVPRENEIDKNHNWVLHLNNRDGLKFSSPKRIGQKVINIDLVFPVFHGLSGEDGTIQGICDLLDVPYIGCGLTTSALALDKVLAKDVMTAYDLRTKPFVFFTKSEWDEYSDSLTELIVTELDYPVYVKPARLGGSHGVKVAKDIDELKSAINEGFSFDDKLLLEKAVANPVDIKISVIGNYFKPSLIQVSLPLVLVNNTYQPLSSWSSSDITELQQLARRAFISFGCTGIAQIDIVANQEDKKGHITEIDTMPHDLAMPIWRQVGVKSEVLLRELVRLADENYHKES